jgi:hypothetical protein
VRIARNFFFKTSADQRHLRNNQRHPLALHVGTHQRAVRVVVFQKRDEAGRYRNELLRRDIHVIHL